MLLVLCSLLAVIESPSSSAHDTGHTPLIVQYHVWEEQPSGTRVGRLLDDLRQSGETGSLGSFQLVHRSSLPITVATRDGTVSTLGRLDREDLCRGDEPCEISFSVLYQKNGAMRFLSVHVQVMDLNDNSPLFPRPRQDVEISETVSLRMRFPLDLAVDSDAGANGLQTYSLSPNPHFALDVRTSGGAKQAELIVIKELDRELQPTLELVLTAWDKGNPPKSGTTSILVTVIDSNDNSPVFEDTPFAIELAEDTVRGTVVVNVHASDPDQGANGEVEYSLSKLTPLDVKRLFSIHPKSGALTVQGPLDFEEKSLYEVDIQARDLGPNAIPSHHKLQIKLQDVNDNAPRIHLTWTPSESPFATVSEGAPNETFLALVMVSDADSGTNGQVQVEIRSVSGHFRLKHIHADNYMIVTNDTLDRERQMDYNLTLLTRDNGSPPLSCVKYLDVRVLDENDNAPVFTKTHYHSVVKENNIAGFRFLTVEAQDVDLDLSGRVSFSIKETNDLETPMGFFSVDSASGALSVQQPLDYEESRSYSFIVEAVDHGYPPMTSSATVLVEVQDVNDNYPIVTDPPTKEGLALVSVPVNLDRGEIVTELGNRIVDDKCRNHSCAIKPRGFLAKTIQAKDLDSGLNGQLTFEITDALPFNIFLLDRHSGQLYVNTTNATEWIGRTFKVGIAVSDMGEPTLTTKTAMEVTFVNLRDHLKNLSRDGRPRYSLTMLVAICLGSTFLFLVLVVGVTKTFCHPDKRDNRAYNCRQAESLYTCHPRRPQKLIQKTDIHLVPALRGPSLDPARDGAQALSSTPPLLDTPNPQCQFAFPPDYSPSHSDSELDGNLPLTPSRILKKPGSIEWNGALPYNSLYRSPHNSRTSSSSSHANSQGGTLKRDRKAKPPHMYPRETTASVSSDQATLRRPKTSDRRVTTEPDHRQILRNLVRLSMAMFAENGHIELSSASPEVQQVSQLLSLLHQGKLQPRPNFRGNKFSHRTARAGPQEADWLSTKDSGHGESEMGDVEWDTDSPVDGLSQLLVSDDVFADAPDPAWMARLSLPMAADYHENLFVPDHAPAADSSASFSTFGKSPEKRLGGGALMCDVSSLFEMLLTQKADAQSRPPADVLYRLSAAWRRLETATPSRDPAS